MTTLTETEQEAHTETKAVWRRSVFDVAAVFAFVFPALTIVQALFFILANFAHPELMTTRSVVGWGIGFAGCAALAVASAATAYISRNRDVAS